MSSFLALKHKNIQSQATLTSVLTVLTAALALLRFVDGGVSLISLSLLAASCAYFLMTLVERAGRSPLSLFIPVIASVTLSIMALAEGGLWSDASLWLPFIPLVAVVVNQRRATIPLFVFVILILVVLLSGHLTGMIEGGTSRACILHFASLLGASVFGVTIALRMKHEQALVENTLIEEARRDPLTGLLNRRGLQDIEVTLKNGSVGVLYLDLDGLKHINDTFGHEVGDAMITNTADVIRKCMRGSDLCARLGGDEFVIVMPQIQTVSHASMAAKRLLETLNQERPSKKELRGSIGVSFTDDVLERSLDSLIDDADRAMYRAKTTGGNSISFATKS